MEKIPKLKDFKAPDGYFETLPDQIMAGIQPRARYEWIKWAAAALIIIGFGFWQSGLFDPEPAVLSFDQQSELFIESHYWTAEEVLSMSEDPNAVLDEIIQEELALTESIWTEEEPTWF